MTSKTAPDSPPLDPPVDQVDALLPQTQCGRCGYAGCLPYAEAMVADGVPINRCPPGGRRTIRALAALLHTSPVPLDSEYGTEPEYESVAWIDEAHCIGCALCYKACPVDAILGAPKLMHSVIRSECTGCELCIAPCPVDCIHMRRVDESTGEFDARAQDRMRRKADLARRRHRFRQFRLARDQGEQAERRRRKKANSQAGANTDRALDKKRDVIKAARERVREKRATRHRP